MQPLSNTEVAAVAKDLLSGFRQEHQWAMLIATAADLDLAIDIGAGQPLGAIGLKVVQLTEAMGMTEMLVREAAFQRPNNKVIQALAARHGLGPAPLANVRMLAPAAAPGLTAGQVVEPADRDAYEADVLRMAGSAKPGDWRRRMVECEAAVCQILFRGDAVGTGFLVAADRVMSNWHVFEDLGAAGTLAALADFSVRFDYRAAEGEAPASLGRAVKVDAGAGYLAASNKAALDYVLLQLVERAGDDVVAGSRGLKRGWLHPAQRVLEANEPVLVLQHPKGRTLELAIGPVTGWVAGRDKEIYQHWANTDNGSSGSPCFSARWELAALHHRADPAGGPRPNRAIAMPAVLADLGHSNRLDLIPDID